MCVYFLVMFVISIFIYLRHEYQIFQKIVKLEFEFPEGFEPVAKDLVEKLLVSISIKIY